MTNLLLAVGIVLVYLLVFVALWVWHNVLPWARRAAKIEAAAILFAAVLLLGVPPFLAPAHARLLDITPEGDSGGYTICVNIGWNGVGIGYCWHTEIPFLSPTPVPKPPPMMPAHESS